MRGCVRTVENKLRIFSYIPNQWTGVFSGMKKPLLFAFALIVVGCGPPDGPHEEYYLSGQLNWKGTYKDGELDGPYEFYHDNGQLRGKTTLKDGELHGPFEVYHSNGQLESKGTFKNGEWEGSQETYYPNGQLEYKGTYKDGEKCGEWYEDGETATHDPC